MPKIKHRPLNFNHFSVYEQATEELNKELSKAIKRGDISTTIEEARGLADLFHRIQRTRIGIGNQISAIEREVDHGATDLLSLFSSLYNLLELQLGRALEAWTDVYPIARISRNVKGVGPILAATLAAYIDITRAPKVSSVWRFAGLDPTSVWLPGQKRPWNAALKVACWKLGESFVKVSGEGTTSFYGQAYRERKAYELERNEKGGNVAAAAAALEKKNYRKETVAKQSYTEGKLPPKQIDMRARRHAVKLFLSHYWEAAYYLTYHEAPPLPYVIEHGGHVDFVSVKDVPEWRTEEWLSISKVLQQVS